MNDVCAIIMKQFDRAEDVRTGLIPQRLHGDWYLVPHDAPMAVSLVECQNGVVG